MERSPVFAAPGSNDYSGLIASSTNAKNGSEGGGFQGLSIEDANDLCEKYLPLAYGIASKYLNKGIALDDLQSASLIGLVLASRKYDPNLGAFGSYARYFCKGHITELFKRKASRKEVLTDQPIGEKEIAPLELPPIDLQNLSVRERRVVVGRAGGETLKEIGAELGFSAERTRQLETRATDKLRRKKGNTALACIRDLLKRRGYRKPPHPLLPFRLVTYPCRTFSRAQIEAYERGEL